jgi:hypothetical protein
MRRCRPLEWVAHHGERCDKRLFHNITNRRSGRQAVLFAGQKYLLDGTLQERQPAALTLCSGKPEKTVGNYDESAWISTCVCLDG